VTAVTQLIAQSGLETEPPPPATRRSRRRPLSLRTVVSACTIAVLVYLVLGPILMLILSSFEDTKGGVTIHPPFPWTLDNYNKVFLSAQTYRLLGVTLLFSAACLIFAFVVSLLFAWLIERTDLPFRNGFYVLLVAPAGMPGLISAIAWGILLNPSNGYINLALRGLFGFGADGPFNVYSLPWMIFVQGLALVPMSFLLITASLRNINPVLEEAARTSGAGFATMVRKVSLPLLRPALVGALIYQFLTVIEAVDIPLVLGLPGNVRVFSTEVYRVTHPSFGLPDYGVSSAHGVLLLALALAPFVFYNRIIGRAQDYATVTGKNFRPKVLELGKWKAVAVLAASAFVFISFILPMLVLLWASTQPYLGAIDRAAFGRMTLHGYWVTLSASLFTSSLRNTLVLGFAAAFLAMALSMLVSWIIVRSRSRYRWVADWLAFMPHAMPGVVIGLATLLIYLILPVGVYGTIWIVVVAMGTQYISLGTRLTTSGIAQIQRALEEAAEASGAHAWQVWRHILIPLLRPVFLNGFLLIFLASVKNLTLPLMLQSPGNVVFATLIYNRWDYGDVTGAAVLSVVLTAITVTAALALRRASAQSEGF
jgi:iron(III) transport system permease protein